MIPSFTPVCLFRIPSHFCYHISRAYLPCPELYLDMAWLLRTTKLMGRWQRVSRIVAHNESGSWVVRPADVKLMNVDE